MESLDHKFVSNEVLTYTEPAIRMAFLRHPSLDRAWIQNLVLVMMGLQLLFVHFVALQLCVAKLCNAD